MDSTHSKICAILIGVLLTAILGLVIGCSDYFTSEDSSDSNGTNIRSEEDHQKVDELWVLTSEITRGDLPMDKIILMIENNSDLYDEDGVLDYDLLKEYVMKNFGDIEIITDPDVIENEIKYIRVCCRYDAKTNKLIITIIRKQ